MAEPVVFASHFRIKESRFEDLRHLSRNVVNVLHEEKPRTVLFLSYVDEDRGAVSFLHAFEDAEAMDLHVEGAAERSRAASELVEPTGFEVYGRPSDGALDSLRGAALSSGAALVVQPGSLAGFLRLTSSQRQE